MFVPEVRAVLAFTLKSTGLFKQVRAPPYPLLVEGWLVGFVALRPKSTAMVIAGRSIHLTTLFPGQA